MTAYLVTNSENSAKSNVQNALAALAAYRASGSSVNVASETAEGINFDASLSSMLKQMTDETDRDLEEIKDRKSAEEQYNLPTSSEEARKANGRKNAFERTDVITDAGWSALENQTKPEDFSILGSIGDGLLTAAKIAGAIIAL